MHFTGFNSIKVRLKVPCDMLIMNISPKFQFHKGAIKSAPASSRTMSSRSCFNSIKVRLKVYHKRLEELKEKSGFNSIKVRLKDPGRSLREDDHPVFQFHKGAIKRRSGI